MVKKGALVEHHPNYRRTWMFPRNIRYIVPWKIAQIVTLLYEQTRFAIWWGNQRQQNQFTKVLEDAGLKRGGVQYDPHSGGARTYMAQLTCLGLVFKRARGNVYLTIAGEDMVNGEPPLPILQEVLFRHQYPSVYSCYSNVKIHPAIKVKPFLFTLNLMKKVGHLTHDELVIPIIYGHNHSCMEVCIDKIDMLRGGAPLGSVIDNPEDVYTPRTRGRDFDDAVADIRDIANTCKNYLKAACLVDIEKIDRRDHMSVAVEYSGRIEDAMEYYNSFISGWTTEEAFQRRLGCWNRKKDNRSIAGDAPASLASVIIAAQFYRFAGLEPIMAYPAEFEEYMTNGFGFDRDEVKRTILSLMPKALSYFESTYLDLSKSGGVKATEFEKTTGYLFKDRLDFRVEHTGQKKRPGKVGGYADLFLVALDDEHCAIIDTKSTPTYKMNAADYRAMANDYIPSYTELLPDGKERKLEFCSYVAGGFTKNINEKLSLLKRETNVPVSAISAFDFLRLCDAKFGQKDIRLVFCKGRELHFNDFEE